MSGTYWPKILEENPASDLSPGAHIAHPARFGFSLSRSIPAPQVAPCYRCSPSARARPGTNRSGFPAAASQLDLICFRDFSRFGQCLGFCVDRVYQLASFEGRDPGIENLSKWNDFFQ
ncbi:hypothetical protein CRG98_030434, partial [Punica granatum]